MSQLPLLPGRSNARWVWAVRLIRKARERHRRIEEWDRRESIGERAYSHAAKFDHRKQGLP